MLQYFVRVLNLHGPTARPSELEETDNDALKIVMPDETVETGYGSSLKKQNVQTLRELAEIAGFTTAKVEAGEHTFYLGLEK